MATIYERVYWELSNASKPMTARQIAERRDLDVDKVRGALVRLKCEGKVNRIHIDVNQNMWEARR